MTIPSYKEIWRISGPIILSLAAQNIINVINTAFLGRVGEIELGASAIGGLLYFCIYMLGFGFATGTQIIMGRRNGEKNFSEIGKTFDNSLYFLLAVALVIFIAIKIFAAPFLNSAIQSKEVLNASIQFLDWRMWGLFFAFAGCLFRSFYVATTNTKIITYSAIIMAVLNISFDYLLIFGKFGFPQLGLKGAAISSVIAEAVSTIYFLLATCTKNNRAKYQLFAFKAPDFKRINSIFKVASPIMIQNFVSLSSWFIFFLIIEKMGEHSLAISNLIRTIYLLLMVPVWGLTATTNTMVSNTIGEDRFRMIPLIIRKIIKVSLSCTLSLILISVLIPHQMIGLYTDNQQLIADTLPSFFVIMGALVLFAVSMIIFSAVSGTGNTRVSLSIEIATLGFYLFTAWLLGIYLKLPVHIIWFGEWIYFIVIGILSYLYLSMKKKQRIHI